MESHVNMTSNDIKKEEIKKLMQTLEETYEELRQQIAQNEKLAQQNKQLEAQFHKEIEHLKAALKKLEEERYTLIEERDHYLRLYTAIEQSRTWRYLKPVRVLFDIIKSTIRLLFKTIKHPNSKNKSKHKYKVKSVNKKRNKLQKKAKREVAQIKHLLYGYGFTKRALPALKVLANRSDNQYVKRLASWEIALWHANQYTKDDALQCLKILPSATEGEVNKEFLRKAVIIEAECHEILGNIDTAKSLISKALQSDKHPDLYLASANLESSVLAKKEWINKVMDQYNLSNIEFDTSRRSPLYDCIITETQQKVTETDAPKVSVIIPVYNAEHTIHISLESILNQTWTNLEVLVVDDCSTDNTVSVIKKYMQKDKRIKLIQSEVNRGAYVARNLGLREATGEFVTVNDADDWSHPEKIEKQAVHLIKNPAVIGNTSQHVRATNDLKFYRRGNPGFYLQPSMPSFMFRRELVMNKIGYWDSVRFAADSEFIRRIKKVFGDEAVVDLETGPLTFQRQSKTSLTGNEAFGYHGYKMGARKEYFESSQYFLEKANNVRYDFPQTNRPFPVPEPMWPKREAKHHERRHFDVIIVSDFRLPGGTTTSNVEEIKAQKRMGLKTGLIQMSRYELRADRPINPKIRELIDGELVQMIVYGEKVSCDVLTLRHPPVIADWQEYIPDVEAKQINIIANQTPKRDYGPEGGEIYNIPHCAKRIKEQFGKEGIWYPIGPLVRDALLQHHAEDLKMIKLADEDWTNIIDVEEWRRPARPQQGPVPKIGRHSRDQYVKWPDRREDLLAAYPDQGCEVHILGGAETPKKILGSLPSNWHVLEFGEVHPKDFLAGLDVFVYFTHPDLVEAFGRAIIEAMAVGVPVIIPPHFRQLFGEAAIYAEPAEVKKQIEKLMSDDRYYESQVNKAYQYVEKHFGYSKHAARLDKCALKKPVK